MPRKPLPKRTHKVVCRFDRRDLILRFWQVIRSTVPAVEGIVRRVMRIARAMGCARGELHKVEIALREALHNAIVHGSDNDPKKRVSVCCLCTEDKGMLLVIRDFGPGFDPSRIPDPTTAENIYSASGRGIFLMRQMMDRVSFSKGGRQVVMKKHARRARPRRRRVKNTLTVPAR